MKPGLEIRINPDGTLEMIYQKGVEDFAKEIGAKVSEVNRASTVEWEEIPKAINCRFPATQGWAVRSAKNNQMALRIQSSVNAGIGCRYVDSVICSDSNNLAIALFATREEAIHHEIQHFWGLKDG